MPDVFLLGTAEVWSIKYLRREDEPYATPQQVKTLQVRNALTPIVKAALNRIRDSRTANTEFSETEVREATSTPFNSITDSGVVIHTGDIGVSGLNIPQLLIVVEPTAQPRYTVFSQAIREDLLVGVAEVIGQPFTNPGIRLDELPTVDIKFAPYVGTGGRINSCGEITERWG